MPDTNAPKVIEINPKKGSAEAYIFSNIILSFDESVQRGIGDITLSKSDGSIIEKFVPLNSGITISDKVLTINPAVNLSYGEKYLINIPTGAIIDTSGNKFLGLTDYDFTVAPKQHIFNIISGGTAGTNTARLYFSANVADGSAALDFEYGSNGWGAASNTGIFEWREVDLNYSLLSTIILSRVPKINPPLSASEFINLFSNLNSIDINAIDIASASPADEAINVGVASNIQITFDRPIERGVGNIILKTSDGATVATYEQNSSNITISSSTLTINPTADLNYNTSYRVEFALSSIQDLAGNDYAGTTSYNFTTNFFPSATATTITTDENTAKTGTLAGTDVDGSTLTFAKVADPSHGTVSINSVTGAYTYTPAANYNGSDSFTFKVNDGTVDSAVATVYIEVQETSPPSVRFWNSPAKTPSETGKSAAIDLTDAIAILKMIVGLNVNSGGVPLSPYQSLAADFNQNGEVGLDDAIGVLKKIVGLSSPEPIWKYFDESKVKTSLTSSESLKPNIWVGDAGIEDLLIVNPTVNIVGVLTGDVNGSWI